MYTFWVAFSVHIFWFLSFGAEMVRWWQIQIVILVLILLKWVSLAPIYLPTWYFLELPPFFFQDSAFLSPSYSNNVQILYSWEKGRIYLRISINGTFMLSVILCVHICPCRPIIVTNISLSLTDPYFFTRVLILWNYPFDHFFLTHSQNIRPITHSIHTKRNPN